MRLKLALREDEDRMTENSGNGSDGNQDQGGNQSAMPEGLPESFWDAEKGALKADDLIKSYGELNSFKTEHDKRLANRLESADKYELSLPEKFEMPEGMNFEFAADSDMAKLGRELAYQMGYSQDEFLEKLVVPYVQEQMGRAQKDATEAEEFYKTEKAKLGEKADDRVKAADAYLKKNLSDDEYQAIHHLATTAAGVSAVEKLMRAANGATVKTDGSSAGGGDEITEDSLVALQKDPRYWRDRDPALHQQVRQGYEKIYGKK